jgi:hypothetical protein
MDESQPRAAFSSLRCSINSSLFLSSRRSTLMNADHISIRNQQQILATWR